jgi:amylosucrase
MQESVRVDATVRQHVLEALAQADAAVGPEFGRRFDAHFPDLCRLFRSLYESRPDWLEQLTALVVQSARSWEERPAALKDLDAGR